jgi:hypothetical protein
MNHAVTVRDILKVLAGFVGLCFIAFGALATFAGGMSDAPEEGKAAGRQGCGIGLLGIVILAAALAACATPAIKDRVVEVRVPVAVQPIKPAQVPAVPAPLAKRPASLSAAADLLLAKVCELEAYALKADPLLRLSAGMQQQALGRFPECER